MITSTHVLLASWFAVVISVTGWAYWVSCKTNDAAEASTLAAEHALRAAQDAHRSIMILRAWWSEAVIIDAENPDPGPVPAPDPVTQPIVVHGPETVPQHVAAGRVDDIYLARALADFEDRLWEWRNV